MYCIPDRFGDRMGRAKHEYVQQQSDDKNDRNTGEVQTPPGGQDQSACCDIGSEREEKEAQYGCEKCGDCSILKGFRK